MNNTNATTLANSSLCDALLSLEASSSSFLDLNSNSSLFQCLELEEAYDDPYPDAPAIEKVWYVFVGIVGSFISILGIGVNSLSLGVLITPEMRTNSGLYLIALTVYDLTYLVANAMFVSFEYFHYGLTGLSDYFYTFTKPGVAVAEPVMNLAVCASVWTTIALSIDRSIGVTQPFQWPQICTRFRVKLVLALTLVWSVFLNIPFMMEWYIGWQINPMTNETSLTSLLTSHGDTYFHSYIYLQLLQPIFDAILPVVILLVINLVIIIALKRQQRHRMKMQASVNNGINGNNDKKETTDKRARDTARITAQVLYISFFTFISRSLRTAMFITMELHGTKYVNYCSLYCGVIAALAHFFNIINATVNFFCYCYFGQKFRSCFVKKYGCLFLYTKKISGHDNETSGSIGRSNTTAISSIRTTLPATPKTNQ